MDEEAETISSHLEEFRYVEELEAKSSRTEGLRSTDQNNTVVKHSRRKRSHKGGGKERRQKG